MSAGTHTAVEVGTVVAVAVLEGVTVGGIAVAVLEGVKLGLGGARVAVAVRVGVSDGAIVFVGLAGVTGEEDKLYTLTQSYSAYPGHTVEAVGYPPVCLALYAPALSVTYILVVGDPARISFAIADADGV